MDPTEHETSGKGLLLSPLFILDCFPTCHGSEAQHPYTSWECTEVVRINQGKDQIASMKGQHSSYQSKWFCILKKKKKKGWKNPSESSMISAPNAVSVKILGAPHPGEFLCREPGWAEGQIIWASTSLSLLIT